MARLAGLSLITFAPAGKRATPRLSTAQMTRDGQCHPVLTRFFQPFVTERPIGIPMKVHPLTVRMMRMTYMSRARVCHFMPFTRR